MKVLLCGFEPFGDRMINNAWEVVKQFEGSEYIKVIKIPVSFQSAHEIVIAEINRIQYDYIIMLGETSSSKEFIRLERVAINFKDSINCDNDGLKPDEEILIPNAPNAYFTKFPVKKTAGQLKEVGYPVKVTNSAGTFVCNSLYFNILHFIETNNLTAKALFVHVPATTQVLSLEEMKNTLDEIIKISLSYKEEQSQL